MSVETQKKSPTELLVYQTELLEQILATQKQIIDDQVKWAGAETKWLQLIDNHTKNISTILSIIFILSILAGLLYSCGIL
jgi:hypothetical protein